MYLQSRLAASSLHTDSLKITLMLGNTDKDIVKQTKKKCADLWAVFFLGGDKGVQIEDS